MARHRDLLTGVLSMGQVLAFYLDDAVVQAVTADVSATGISLILAETVGQDELDGLLARVPQKKCIVCCNPAVFYQDIISLPAAAQKFYHKLVMAEIRKLHPERGSCSFFYKILGDTAADGSGSNRVVVFSYADDAFSQLLSTFNRHGKIITHLYPAPYSIFKLAISAFADAKSRLFVAGVPGEKLILLSDNNELCFVRKVESVEDGLPEADVGNINMTVDYCFQSLRVKPAEAVLLNLPAVDPEKTKTAITFRNWSFAELAGIDAETVGRFLAPLAACLHFSQNPQEADILPAEYVSYTRTRWLINNGIRLNLLFSVIFAVLIWVGYSKLGDLRKSIQTMRSQLAGSGQLLGEFRKLDDELKGLDHSVQFLNSINNPVDPVMALSALGSADTGMCQVRSVSLQKKGEGQVGIKMEGTINSRNYSETQAAYEELRERLSKKPGLAVESGSVDVKQRTFIVETRYTGTAGK